MEREKENPWFSPDRPAALIPPPTTAGSPPPPLPDPPDPSPSPPAEHFPTLQSTIVSPPLTKKQISQAFETASAVLVGASFETTCASPMAQDLLPTTDCPPLESSDFLPTPIVNDLFKGFTVHIPKNSIPFPPPTAAPKNQPPKPSPQKSKTPNKRIPLPVLPNRPTTQTKAPFDQNPTQNTRQTPQSYAQKVKAIANTTLQRLAPLTYSETGIPQVIIPDEVFLRGAELHKDFIQGFFFAKMPSYQALQSVLNFMWGKGTKLDIRTNPKARSFLVRIPNEYIRAKVLEKKIWYVAPLSIPTSIPLWAHLKGLPLDLRSLEGLSFAAGLIGEPKETDEFTMNLTDLELAHVKIEADLTKPLPGLIELKRSNGETFPVEVLYPWIPPSCSHCRELGHIMKYCLQANPAWVKKQTNSQQKTPHEENSGPMEVESPSTENIEVAVTPPIPPTVTPPIPPDTTPLIPPEPTIEPVPSDVEPTDVEPTDVEHTTDSMSPSNSPPPPPPTPPPSPFSILSLFLKQPKIKPLNTLNHLTPPTIQNSPSQPSRPLHPRSQYPYPSRLP
ncbi:hypothetical protein IGI04_018566 [Brassica rapa subsp. trilocularis]|uniref:DUF4283 domain-containing protein n=1 Tax=Brassica rapa subsp. trilocularis TaxID=1813537 RepID=A0ABQ7MDB2_BRACM|nr:hypothetical protein IGI04_018566 [Brassica rapa subsp. trilocularis]